MLGRDRPPLGPSLGPELIGRRVPPPVAAAPPRRRRPWLARLVLVLLVIALAPVALIALYRVVPPPITPLMVIRSLDGLPTHRQWVPLSRISPNLGAAVMTTEDQNFCRHRGFDVEAIRAAWASYEQGGRLRGASTISQQTAKNLFLWPGQDYVRKGLEAYLTVWLELLWPKQRILEVYLNIIEWGPGIYGAEAAAQAHFGRPAASLTRQQAALLASVLPNPRQWSPTRPGPHVERRAAWAMARMDPFLRGCT
jgi:monofunctional biosynthetic peptidoglycan transglycosylase